MAEKRELIKFNVSAVILVKEGDKILREEVSDAIACYSLERVAELWAQVKQGVDEANATNRKTRRASEKET